MSMLLGISIFTLSRVDPGEVVGEVSGAKIESSMDNTFGDINFKTDEDEKEANEEDSYQESEEGYENNYEQFDAGEAAEDDEEAEVEPGYGDVDVSYDFDDDEEGKGGEQGGDDSLKI